LYGIISDIVVMRRNEIAIRMALDARAGSLLYGVGPNDPWTFLVAGGLLVAVALAASFGASQLDPAVALRYE
jgi:hypothetical protein